MSCVVSSRNESIAKGVESLRENQPRLSDIAIVVGVVPMTQSSLLRNALIDGHQQRKYRKGALLT